MDISYGADRSYSCCFDPSQSERINGPEVDFANENFINFYSLPSLKYMAKVNVAIALFNQSDVRNAILELPKKSYPIEYRSVYFSCYGRTNFNTCVSVGYNECVDYSKEIDEKVISNVSLLPLPPPLKTEITNIVWPIKLQILTWFRQKETKYINPIYWTVEGTIDEKKTIGQLIFEYTRPFSRVSCRLSKRDYFNLACKYCLADYVFETYNKLPRLEKRSYWTYYFCSELRGEDFYDPLESYWLHIIHNEIPNFMKNIPLHLSYVVKRNDSIYRNMVALLLFKNDKHVNNITAIKYFWKKLTEEEIRSNILQWVDDELIRNYRFGGKERPFDGLFFLLSNLNDAAYQSQVFRKYGNPILLSLFLRWPLQRFVIPALEVMWDCLDPLSFAEFLTCINQRDSDASKKLIKEIWCITPISFKTYFIKHLINTQKNNSPLKPIPVTDFTVLDVD